MKLQKQVKWRDPDASHSDTLKKILIGGIALFFLTLAGCITGGPGTVVRTSPAPKTPRLPQCQNAEVFLCQKNLQTV